ncbi:MAG: hypothetical protein RL336_1769, partial [Pseudomonadota bacterium]
MQKLILLTLFLSLISCGGSGPSTTNPPANVDNSTPTNTDTSTGSTSGDNTSTDNTSNNTGTSTLTGNFTLLAWNDLGMHCMDADYSVFSILPPYNNLHAQLINKSSGLVVTDAQLTYESLADPQNSINTTSSGKTNFWTYVRALFGAEPAENEGLTGTLTASTTPQPLTFHTANQEYIAEGIPLTPKDDNLTTNYYPMVNVVAKDMSGNVLATAQTVLPVSDEMSCKSCHASRLAGSTAQMAAQPSVGWLFDNDSERDYRRNILAKHDERQGSTTLYQNALAAMNYSTTGLLDTADSGTPILCASCHSSNALPGTGIEGISSLTQAMHAMHGSVINPDNDQIMDEMTNRESCYQCHPGSTTQCLRGAMGNAKDANGELLMQCQDCHGSMSKVGDANRIGWLDQPNCQACHHDGLRELTALNAYLTPKHFSEVSDTRFATTPNTPVNDVSLYRMSKGHGGLQCESCHGATHAIYPSAHENDNLQAIDLQGYAGTIAQCTNCHETMPRTQTGGPHGMHSIGQFTVDDHNDWAGNDPTPCTACHGAD